MGIESYLFNKTTSKIEIAPDILFQNYLLGLARGEFLWCPKEREF